MNPLRQKLPIGIETFSKIILDGHYYVDKTGFIRQLIDEGQYYFLARPRRFGKSLPWRGTPVYNPFDLLLLLREREFGAWWFETGTPTFLIDLLARHQSWLPLLEPVESDADLLGSFEVGQIPLTTLMFQTGYLTIANEKQVGESQYFQLRFPNQEVRQSLFSMSGWKTPPILAEST